MKTILVDAVMTFVSEEGVIFNELHDLLETYPNKKIIVTNANPEEQKQYGLDKVPYGVFSLNHNPDKTDPKYFEILLSNLNLEPSDVIYFEHNPAAVESAVKNGIISYHYDENTKDLVTLKQFLDSNL